MDFTYNTNQIALFDDDHKMVAEVTFPEAETEKDTVTINHTYVDPSLGGRGIAGMLMEAVVSELQSQNKKAILTCSYAVKWFEKHPEFHDLVKQSK